ncbi:MAG: CPBP family glutamic-type intramembrane protease [Acidobacteria bacterium]|nr:CPBP family glutamic-type intramembrane protease [Acidobacteriota bacterium]
MTTDPGVQASGETPPPRQRADGPGRLYALVELIAVVSTIAMVMMIGAYTANFWMGPFSIVAAVIVIRFSLWLQGRGLSDCGLGRPRGLLRTILLGIGAWFVVSIVNGLLINPIIFKLLGATPQLQAFEGLRGNPVFYVQLLLLSWTIAAFGEELLFRGYLLGRLAGLLGGGRVAHGAALLLQAAAFGAAHVYQGWAGVLVTGLVGLLLGAIFLRARRNLWVIIIAHGLVDTVSLTVLYLGLDELIRDLT